MFLNAVYSGTNSNGLKRLTVTNVVFEYEIPRNIVEQVMGLTVTNVVFEFLTVEASSRLGSRLTVTNVVFE